MPAALIGRELVLGIRPEHLEVCAPEDALFTLQTEMRGILGADILVHGLFGKELLVARLSAMEHPAPGQALPLRALPGCLSLVRRRARRAPGERLIEPHK